MKPVSYLLILLIGLGVSNVFGQIEPLPISSPKTANGTAQTDVLATLFKTPLHFVANQGQLPSSVVYAAKSEGPTVYCTEEGLTFGFAEGSLLLKFAGGRRVKPQARGQLPGKVNYFLGNDSTSWQTDIPTFEEVIYPQVYPGIDLVYSGNQRRLKYTLYLQPHADPNQIQIIYEGVDELSVDVATGELIIQTPWGEMRDAAPVAHQEVGGIRKTVDISFQLMGKNRVGFVLGDYNSDDGIVLDPIYSTYLGGSHEDRGWDIAVDNANNIYVTGWTNSPNLPATNPYQGHLGGQTDAFVTKLSSDGMLLYSTYLGGNGADRCFGIAIDSVGNVYVTGETTSFDFPIQNPYQTRWSGKGDSDDAFDAFVTKISMGGNTLIYSTYLGGSNEDKGISITVDIMGNAYIAGQTASSDFPTKNPYQASYAGGSFKEFDAFMTKLDANGSAIIYSTYLGGNDDDFSRSIAVDSSGSTYITGDTKSSDFPTKNPYQTRNAGGNNDAFVTKFDRNGNTLIYSTYLGGTRSDYGYGIAVDSSNNAYVTGWTDSFDFPTKNPYQSYNAGDHEVFVAKLDDSGIALIYSTYVGGSQRDWGNDIAVDSSGDTYIVGYTDSTDFPMENSYQASYGGGQLDSLMIKLDDNGILIYSTYLGGKSSDSGFGIAVDNAGNVHITGQTDSVDFPIKNSYQANYTGGRDAFVASFELNGTDTVPLTPPTALITNPQNHANLTGTVDVIGSAASPKLQTWIMDAAQGDTDNFLSPPIAFGTDLVEKGLLGKWDTSNLPDGVAVLRLRVTDTDGNRESYTVVVNVDNHTFAELTSPTDRAMVEGVVMVAGTAESDALREWILDVAPGENPDEAAYLTRQIRRETASTTNQTLANWDTTDLDDGIYTLRLQVFETSGRVETTTRLLELNNQTPPPPTVTATSLHGDYITDNDTLTVNGTMPVETSFAGEPVETSFAKALLIGTDGQVIRDVSESITVNGISISGDLNVGALPSVETIRFAVIVEDMTQKRSTPGTSPTFTVDHDAPSVTIDDPTDGVYVQSPPIHFTGTVTDKHGVAKVEFKANNEDAWHAATLNDDSWSFDYTPTLEDFAFEAQVRAIDYVSHVSSVTGITVNYFSFIPTVNISSPTDNSIISETVPIIGSVNGAYVLEYTPVGAENWISIQRKETPVDNGELGRWETSGLDGIYQLRLTVGNVSVKRTNITVLPADQVNLGAAEIRTTPAMIIAGSRGNTVEIIYTAHTPIEDGAITVTVPDDWSPPQPNSNSTGYTTIESNGSIGEATFKGQTAHLPVSSLQTGQTITVIYGRSEGDSGALAGGIGPATFIVSVQVNASIALAEIPNQPSVTVLAEAEVSPEKSAVKATSEVVADGKSFAEIEITVIDEQGHPASGKNVTITAIGEQNTISQPTLPTNTEGVTTARISSTKAEVKTITAKTGEIEIGQTAVEFIPGKPTAVKVQSDIGTLPADGASTASITVTVFDANDNPINDETVTMQTQEGQITSPAEFQGNGSYTATYTAGTVPGEVEIQARTSNGEIGTVTVPITEKEAQPPPPVSEFAISALKSEATASAGNVAAYLIQLEGKNGFDGSITLFGPDDLPPNVKATLDPKTVTLSASETTVTSQLTLTLPDEIASGGYSFTVVARAENGESKRLTLNLKVESASRLATTLTLIPQPQEVPFMGKLSLFGALAVLSETPVELSDLPIQIPLTSPSGNPHTFEANTDTEGNYQLVQSFSPDEVGQWLVAARFEGNPQLQPSFRERSFTVTKGVSEISFDSGTEGKLGAEIEVVGRLEPKQKGERLTLKILRPDGAASTLTNITTEALGVFRHKLKLEIAGDWEITATWAGNEQYQNTTQTWVISVSQEIGKAIIVLGGGNRKDNPAWSKFNGLAEDVYRIFLKRKFDATKDIQFLSPDPDATKGANNVTSLEALKLAITQWAKSQVNPQVPLYLYLLSHNLADQFLLEKRGNSETFLAPALLDEWLSQLPTGTPVTLIIEACYSGNFIRTSDDRPSALIAPNRTIIVSARGDERAIIMGNRFSFSQVFFNQIDANKTIEEAFHTAINQPYIHAQFPLIDADGDGTPSQPQDFAAIASRHLPADITSLASPPEIIDLTPSTTLPKGVSSLRIEVELLGREISRVFATVIPPDFDPKKPFNSWGTLDFPELDLAKVSEGKYTAVYANLTRPGDYTVIVNAENTDGRAEPVQTTITVPGGENTTPWDVNSDGVVNVFDLVPVGSQLGQNGALLSGDVNADGAVNLFDLVTVASHFGQHTDAAAPAATGAPEDRLVLSNPEPIRRALVELETLAPPPPGAVIAFEVLREWFLNAHPIITETRVLDNYPNPFNPDTWIGYQLAKESEVTLRIYAESGQLVKQLNLGQKPAGLYLTRERAAYWNGKSETGEKVSSGVYFYQFNAGDFTTTKRMVILK